MGWHSPSAAQSLATHQQPALIRRSNGSSLPNGYKFKGSSKLGEICLEARQRLWPPKATMHEPLSWAQYRRNPWKNDEITYDFSISTGIVSISEIRRSPYHKRITHSPSEAKSLVDGEIKELHSRDWNCYVHIFDIHHDGRLPFGESVVCRFVSENQEYYTRDLEEFQSRVLELPAPHAARLVVVEDLVPAAMEVLGHSLNLDPGFFHRHIGNSWGSASSSEPLSEYPETEIPDLTFVSPYPRMLEVEHPFAWNQPDWRTECFKRAAKFLQCRQLSPVLDVPEQRKVLCTAFEHTTVNIQVDSTDVGQWKAFVLFPSSVKRWEEGSLRVVKHQPARSHTHSFRGLSGSQDPDVALWLSALQNRSENGGELTDPFHVVDSLFREALGHWNAHLVHVARAVDQLSMRNFTDDEIGLQPQQQIRALIFHETGMLSEILDSIRAAIEANISFKASGFSSDKEAKTKRPQLEDLHRRFTHVKTRLERPLPALQHYIDIIRVRQQNRLAETQLKESRKAIQQADTIKRLTILAFIYIPIQTSATIYGMNISEIVQRQRAPSVWTFAVTTLVLLAATLLAAGWNWTWAIVYRQKHQMFGSLRAYAARQLARIGIHVNANAERAFEGQMNDARPSWIV